jgi:hypothetical protein
MLLKMPTSSAPPKGALVAQGLDFLPLATTKRCGQWSFAFGIGFLGIPCANQVTILAYSKIGTINTEWNKVNIPFGINSIRESA